jgi:hypothetical protein
MIAAPGGAGLPSLISSDDEGQRIVNGWGTASPLSNDAEQRGSPYVAVSSHRDSVEGAAAEPSEVPQFVQNFALGGFSVAHSGQVTVAV